MSRQTQLILVLLALLPVWYSLAQRRDEKPTSLDEHPYYMECGEMIRLLEDERE